MRNQTVKAAALVAAGVLLLASCGTNKEETPAGGEGDAASCDQSKGTLVIGVIAPLSGELSALGKGIENSARLAVDQANEECSVPGYELVVQAEDDQKTPQLGAQAATKLVSTPNVVGVVSTLNSNVSQSVQPILDQAGILQVSPANTADSLTKGEDFLNNPERPYPTYFRTCTVDSLQGPFAADYLVEKSGKTKIAVITDGLTYGEGLADSFVTRAEEKGAEIVTRQKVGEKDTDFSGVIAAVQPFEPDAVYYGGQYPQAGPLSKQFASAGLNVPVMGGDGIFDDTFIELGGKDGDLATSVGAPTEDLDSAQAFVEAYEGAGYTEGFSAYGAFSYDATNAIVASLGETVGDAEWDDSMRPAMVENTQSYEADGATGKISFDEFGDSTNKVLTIYQVTSGEWSAIETGEFAG